MFPEEEEEEEGGGGSEGGEEEEGEEEEEATRAEAGGPSVRWRGQTITSSADPGGEKMIKPYLGIEIIKLISNFQELLQVRCLLRGPGWGSGRDIVAWGDARRAKEEGDEGEQEVPKVQNEKEQFEGK